jgi:hypothetical protein
LGDHFSRKAITLTGLGGMSILRIHDRIMSLVDVNQNDHIIPFQTGGDFLVRLKKRVQLVAPGAPIGPELQENPFAILARQRQGVGNLPGTIGRLIVNGLFTRWRSIARLHCGDGGD